MGVQVYLPGFLSSNLYYKYLSDLINSVRADEFVHISTPGQPGPADNGRPGSNSSEGPQAQVMPPSLTHVVGAFLILLTFRPAHQSDNAKVVMVHTFNLMSQTFLLMLFHCSTVPERQW